ncbi:MAG TPA: HAMP domain-containing protein, partial [Oligella sp.]|nr:HAMP domain-containing protein [Oligella sp.]
MAKVNFSNINVRIQRLIGWFFKLGLALGVIGLITLLLMLFRATDNVSGLTQQFDLLLMLNGVLTLILVLWVTILIVRLIRQIRRRQFGARLTSRFAFVFAIMAVLPGLLIYVISVQFMAKSVESWFNVKVDSALESGLSLGRASLNSYVQDLSTRARQMALELRNFNDSEIPMVLAQQRDSNTVITDALVFSGASGNRVIAFAGAGFGGLLPELPSSSIMNQLRLSNSYAQAEIMPDSNPAQPSFRIRVIVPVIANQLRYDSLLPTPTSSETYWLQVTRSVPENIAVNMNEVQQGIRDYEELSLSRISLRRLFTITLTLALVMTVLASLAAALSLARRVVRPLLTLAEGTQAVAVGDYRPLPEPNVRDEITQLTRSFNVMTFQLDEARRQVESNRQQLEKSNVYLENVMASLSSGVIVFDTRFNVSSVNRGASDILRVDLRAAPGRPLEFIKGLGEFTKAIRNAFAKHAAVESEKAYWQEQIELNFHAANESTESLEQHRICTLLMRGTRLMVDNHSTGYLVVFDDISEVMSASRTVAWGEVARRLAHEIKNPLTPIQLSAERLAMKLEDKLDEKDSAMLLRSTNTIINQVTSLKNMVDDFRDYARTPPATFAPVDINALIVDIAVLYGWDPEHKNKEEPLARQIELSLDPDLPLAEADQTQLRQVMNNLLG